MTQQPLTKVEIILDSGARTRNLRYLVEELQQFFRKAGAETGHQVQVGYVDTPQLFHEKTGYVTPDQAPARPEQWPERIRGICYEMRRGEYEVTAPGATEEYYLDALRHYVFNREHKQAGLAEMREHGVEEPEELQGPLLQTLYDRHVVSLTRHDTARSKREFKQYAQVRADSGEHSVAEYLQHREIPEDSGKTITLFVSQDRGALENVAAVAAQKSNGQEEIFSLGIEGAKQMLHALVKNYKAQHPEVASLTFDPPQVANSHAARVSRTETTSQRTR